MYNVFIAYISTIVTKFQITIWDYIYIGNFKLYLELLSHLAMKLV